MVESITTSLAYLSIEELKILGPNLTDQLIQEALDTFKQFDMDNEGKVEGYDWILTMMMAMGCPYNKKQFKELYYTVFNEKPVSELAINLKQYIQMLDHFVKESDPIDGVIATIQDEYDPEETGKCTFENIIKFLEEQNYFDADKEAILKIIDELKDSKTGEIDYAKAMRTVIQ